ncbi:hypothetical protein Rcae01_04763 [Novipirellula caenicola]|uniref:Uncharacterized protein n=1 Tax=Novipirellula caenicola TaxID=1536901 RepID=A0ABP9VVT7_9BACT
MTPSPPTAHSPQAAQPDSWRAEQPPPRTQNLVICSFRGARSRGSKIIAIGLGVSPYNECDDVRRLGLTVPLPPKGSAIALVSRS